MKKILFLGLPLLTFSNLVLAMDHEGGDKTYIKAAAYFLAVGLAAYGGTAAQSRAASAALEGIARNPGAADKIMTPMILGLALMESLVIFTLISVFLFK